MYEYAYQAYYNIYDEVYSPLRQYGQYSDIQTSKRTAFLYDICCLLNTKTSQQ